MRWVAALYLLPALAFAQGNTLPDSVLEARTTEVASTLRCPVCQGESIQDSPADLAQQMRLLVKDMLREGKTPDEIRDYFVVRYGEWILLQPKASGLNLLIYIVPFVVVIGGGIIIVKFVSRNSSPTPTPVD